MQCNLASTTAYRVDPILSRDPDVGGHLAPTLEDAEEDRLWGAEAQDCGFVPGTTLSGV